MYVYHKQLQRTPWSLPLSSASFLTAGTAEVHCVTTATGKNGASNAAVETSPTAVDLIAVGYSCVDVKVEVGCVSKKTTCLCICKYIHVYVYICIDIHTQQCLGKETPFDKQI